MAVRLEYVSRVTAVKTFTGPFVSPTDATMTDNGLDKSATLDATTTPPVTKKATFSVTMVAGVGTIDLTALPGDTSEEIVVGTGLKVQSLKFRNPTTNANKITVAKGASNVYGMGASGDTWTNTLSPGMEMTVYGDDANPDVGGSAKVIDVTGTGAQVLNVGITLG
jgi:hypothetical protein